MVMRFDPFREIERVAQQMLNTPSGERQSSMPMDAFRAQDRFYVLLDLPGVDPDSIDITVEKNVVTVRAERSWKPEPGQEVLVQERPQGRFTRQLFLGEGLDAENVQASYEHGVLTITIPVAEQAKPRKVSVSTQDEGRTLSASTESSGSAGAPSSTEPATASSST